MATEVTHDPAVIEIRTYQPSRTARAVAGGDAQGGVSDPTPTGHASARTVPVSRRQRHLCVVTSVPGENEPRPTQARVYEGPEWIGELEAKLMPLLEEYGSVLVEDSGLWQQWPGAKA
jgi:hypothetical protein